MLHHQETALIVDRQLKSVASLKILEFFGPPTSIDAVDGALIQALGLCGGNHALQLSFHFCTFESGVPRVPELPLTRGFPFRDRVTTEIAQDDLFEKTLKDAEKKVVSQVFIESVTDKLT